MPKCHTYTHIYNSAAWILSYNYKPVLAESFVSSFPLCRNKYKTKPSSTSLAFSSSSLSWTLFAGLLPFCSPFFWNMQRSWYSEEGYMPLSRVTRTLHVAGRGACEVEGPSRVMDCTWQPYPTYTQHDPESKEAFPGYGQNWKWSPNRQNYEVFI